MEWLFIVALTSIAAGFLGSMMGIGGGVIIVPALAGLLGVDIRLAVGASLVAVTATSSAAATAFIRDNLTNVRLAIFLESATTSGAVIGVIIGSQVPRRMLAILFILVLLFAAWNIFRRRHAGHLPVGSGGKWESKLALAGSYVDESTGKTIDYGMRRIPLGWFLMLLAGMMSGMLGIGAGVLKVPTMDAAMGLPAKASSATSNFMIGVTAASGAVTMYFMGYVNPLLTAPVVMGVFLGSLAGSRLMPKVKDGRIRLLFVLILLAAAIEMAIKQFKG